MVFIRDLVIKKGLTKCNVNVISMKTSFFIKIIKLNNYKKVKLWPYQYFISKLIYFVFNIRSNITFAIS